MYHEMRNSAGVFWGKASQSVRALSLQPEDLCVYCWRVSPLLEKWSVLSDATMVDKI